MSEADYYPLGAYKDASAPYNQCDPEPREFVKDFIVTLYQTVTVKDDRWYKDGHGEVYEENCDFIEDYKNSYTPSTLLKEYAEIMKQQINELKETKPRGWKYKVEVLEEKIECCSVNEEIIELD